MPAEQANGAELDLGAFKKRLEAARAFVVTVEDLVLGCVLPHEIDERVVAMRNGESGAAGAELWKFELAVRAVRSWNATVGTLAREDKYAALPLPCTAETVRMLLSARLDVADAVGNEIVRRRLARESRLEASAKNSGRASPTSETQTKRAEPKSEASMSSAAS